GLGFGGAADGFVGFGLPPEPENPISGVGCGMELGSPAAVGTVPGVAAGFVAGCPGWGCWAGLVTLASAFLKGLCFTSTYVPPATDATSKRAMPTTTPGLRNMFADTAWRGGGGGSGSGDPGDA